MLVIPDAQTAGPGIEAKLELAPLQDLTVVIAEEGQQNLSAQLRLGGLPVDVEELRIGGAWTVLEYVQPPEVLVASDSHVVGNEVEDLSHSVPVQCIDEGRERLLVAHLRVECIVIGDVVPVRASGTRFQVGCAVDVAHTERVEVGHESFGIPEGEAAVELQAVCRGRRRLLGKRGIHGKRVPTHHSASTNAPSSRYHAADQGGISPCSRRRGRASCVAKRSRPLGGLGTSLQGSGAS